MLQTGQQARRTRRREKTFLILLVNRDQGRSLEDSRRGCRELGGYLVVMRNDSFKEDTADLAEFLLSLDGDQENIWVDHPLTYGPKGVGMLEFD